MPKLPSAILWYNFDSLLRLILYYHIVREFDSEFLWCQVVVGVVALIEGIDWTKHKTIFVAMTWPK
jgi:hypothetical protein